MAEKAEAQHTEQSSATGIADLKVISYEKLYRRDPEEMTRLLSACEDWGFFYLNLQDEGTSDYVKQVDDLFAVSREYFERPLAEKLQDSHESWSIFNICGYKPLGLDTGNMEHKKDGCEGMRIPVDLVFSPESHSELFIPNAIRPSWAKVDRYIRDSHDMSRLILACLSDSLNLEANDRFEANHRVDSPSTSTAVMQHYPLTDLPREVSVGHFTHTDTGSITILFNTEWGLQVYSPFLDRWEYVAPKKDHAIVNLGDSLKFMSKLRLKSCLHRVVPWSERWVSSSRYALIFFLRPNNEAEFCDLEGKQWTAGEWLDSKFLNYRSSLSDQRLSTMSTGKKGFVGIWDASAPFKGIGQAIAPSRSG